MAQPLVVWRCDWQAAAAPDTLGEVIWRGGQGVGASVRVRGAVVLWRSARFVVVEAEGIAWHWFGN